jgi:hypothetical protein
MVFTTYVDGVEHQLDMAGQEFPWSDDGEPPLSLDRAAAIARAELSSTFGRAGGWHLRQVNFQEVATGSWICTAHFVAVRGDGTIIVGINSDGKAIFPISLPTARAPVAGTELERAVYRLLSQLEEVGLVYDLRMPDYVEDVHKHLRRLDLSFHLRGVGIDVLINIECKGRKRPLTADQLDQLKTFKSEILDRNIFWFVYDGELTQSARETLDDCGIPYYRLDELDAAIAQVRRHIDLHSREITELIRRTQPLRAQNMMECWRLLGEAAAIAARGLPPCPTRPEIHCFGLLEGRELYVLH